MEQVLENEGEQKTRLAYSTNVVQLRPGDQCVLVRTESVNATLRAKDPQHEKTARTQHCVLIGSAVRQGLALPAERIVWVTIDEQQNGRATVRFVGAANAADILLLVKGHEGTPHKDYDNPFQARDMGIMQDGARFLVYRFAIYMDGFKQTKAQRDVRSVGVCYLLPLGLSLEARRGTGAPRTINIASSSVSQNGVLKLLMQDISRAAVEGFDATDPYGRPVRIFLDPVTFFGDYPAVCGRARSHGQRVLHPLRRVETPESERVLHPVHAN